MSARFNHGEASHRYFTSLAARIANARREVGFTQTEMADIVGTSLSTYRKIEGGDSSVAAETLWRVITVLKSYVNKDLLVDLD